jgi:hypothetical protein
MTPRKLAACAIWMGVGSGASAGEAWPPPEYSLDDVVIEYVTDEEMLPRWGFAIRLTGAGKGMYHEADPSDPVRVRELDVDPEEILGLLELCYRDRFFDLEDRYTTTAHPRLDPNGTVQVIEVVTSDAPMPALTVRIGNYAKTVRYLEPYGNPPDLLQELAKRMRGLAGVEP